MSKYPDRSPIRRRANQLITTEGRQRITDFKAPEKPFDGQVWTDNSETPPVKYQWREDNHDWGVINPDGTVDDSTAPSVPTGLTATAGTESVKLEWTKNTESDFSYYEIYQHTADVSGSATKIAELMKMNYLTITGLTVGTALYFWLKSVDYSGNASAFTSSVTATPAAAAPGSVPLSSRGWAQTCTWSSTDYRTVAWAAGDIITADGTTYNITGANTGNMSAITYIYLDTDTSTTALQTTTTGATAVGANKLLVAVANLNADNAKQAVFQAFGID